MNTAPGTNALLARRRWSLRRQLLVAFFAVLALVLCIFYWMAYRDQLALDRLIAQLDANDPGWTFDAMQKAIPPLKPAEDAGVELVELLKLTTMRETIPFPGKSEWYKLYRKNYEEAELFHYESFLEQHPNCKLPTSYRDKQQFILNYAELPEVLNRARSLANYRTGRLQHTIKPFLFASLLPDAQGTRNLANLLMCDSQLQMEAGNVELALADMNGILAVARVLDDDHFVICELIRMAMVNIVCKQTERLLAQALTLSDKQLQSLQRQLEKELKRTDATLTRMIRQERATYDHDLQEISSGKQTYREILQIFGRRSGFSFKVNWLDDLVVRLFPETALGWGNRPSSVGKERLVALQFYSHGIEWSKQQEHLLRSSLEQWKSTGPKLTPYQRAIFMMGWVNNEKEKLSEFNLITSTLKAWLQHRTKLRAAISMLAMERYRLKTGNWPASLESLVPGYLSALPLDPETGKPLVLKAVTEGYVIYGVWNNGIDDGGYIRNDDKGPPLDAGYQLWHVHLRGKIMEKEAQEYYQQNKRETEPLQAPPLLQIPPL